MGKLSDNKLLKAFNWLGDHLPAEEDERTKNHKQQNGVIGGPDWYCGKELPPDAKRSDRALSGDQRDMSKGWSDRSSVGEDRFDVNNIDNYDDKLLGNP